MEKTPESVAAEVAALQQSLAEVTAAVNKYVELATQHVGSKDVTASGQVSQSRRDLSLSTSRLLRTVRGPVEMVTANFENSVYTGCLRAVLEMGVVEALPADGSSASASALAEKLGVDKDLLVRLMRNVTVMGPFAEVGREEYAHTPFSQIFLVPAIAGFFRAMFDEFAPVNAKMYEFFRETKFRNPDSDTINPYCFAHQTGGKTMWQYLDQYPARLDAFNAAQKVNGEANPWTVSLYPFEEELRKFTTNDDTVLLIDIGGGVGHVAKQIRGLTQNIPGKVILQDRPAVISEITDPLPGVEKMEYDFFTPQPLKGALIYYIRHCLHDWPDKDCVRILKQIAAAIDPTVSRLVISDSVLPESNVDLESAWLDVTMMAISGSERTQTQWERILDESGFKLHKVYQAPGSKFAAIEAYLK
ncbi:S-adenosyl-L-methionine-dependent methyltransferase [Xylogone sp. PMI_703]|nr:S-adenosyl-L-methionine-dependent methyltransferase [Xylogone sp. PMI_703]